MAHSPDRPLAIIRTPELLKLVGVSASTLWRWERNGSFPTRLRLGPNVTGWLRSDVEQWILQAQQRTPSRAGSDQ